MKRLWKCVAFALFAIGLTAQEPSRAVRVQKAAAPPAGQETRVALVIGNGSYQASPLKNPVNDARAMAAKLKQLGFEVLLRENLTQRQIGPTLREFRSRLSPGAEALFFYAGHGLQVGGVNYLPAVDADISAEEDVPTQSIDVNKVMDLMDAQKTRLNLVFLDACRNNPYTRGFRSAGGGLARVSPPSGTIISYATRPGSVAADGEGAHGLYTEYLLRAMDEPGVIIEQSLKEVFAGVKLASHGRQEPWQEGGLEGDFFFRPGGQVPGAAAVSTLPPPPVAVAQVGGLQVSVNAPDAQVYVDGALKGTASPTSALNLPDLPVGDVQVRVEAPGYTLAQRGFSVEPGRWTQAEIRLAKAQPETPPAPVGNLLPGDAQESRLIGTVWHFQWNQQEVLATSYFRLLRNGSMAYGKMADLSDSKIDATDQWSLQGGVLVVEWSDRYATERFNLGIDWPVGTTLPGTIISKHYSGSRDCTLTRIQ